MKSKSKLTSREQTEHASAQQHTAQQVPREFATPEEMLRHDAANTTVPPEIARKLQSSVQPLTPRPPQSWWQRLLGG